MTLRIVVVAPLPGVLLAVQRGRDELLSPASSSRDETRFDLTVEVALTGGDVRWRGPVVQGPAAGRFVYACATVPLLDGGWTLRRGDQALP